jgi:hypothetical protein
MSSSNPLSPTIFTLAGENALKRGNVLIEPRDYGKGQSHKIGSLWRIPVKKEMQNRKHGERESITAPYQSAKPGDIITFGTYPQTADGSDRMPIRWRVLENSGRGLFILSEYILDCKRYHRQYADITWRDCDLRKWLNTEFHNVAFCAAEKELVRTVLCADNGEDSPDTKDKVSLLGAAELKELTDVLGKDLRRAMGTEFAKVKRADGCRLYVYDKSVEADYITENGKRHGCSWWWLRTRLGSASRAAFVGTHASIRGYGRVNLSCYGVRPALRLNLR